MKRDKKYPRFYADVQKLNNRKKKSKKMNIKEEDIMDYNCPMDIIYKIIENEVVDLRNYKELNIPTLTLRYVFEYKNENYDRKQHKKIIGIVESYNIDVAKLDKDAEDYHEKMMQEFDECMRNLSGLTIKPPTMKALIAYAFLEKNAKIRDKLLIALYDKNREEFIKCFKKRENIPQIIVKSA